MKRRTLVLVIVAFVCAVAAGPKAWAKVFWMAGAPGLALPLMSDDATRGAALYQLGRFEEADTVFAAAGRSVTYNRGMTLATVGQYHLSVAYFNAVLFANRYDEDALYNRDLVEGLIDPVFGTAVGHGRIRTILSEAGVDTEAFDPENPTLSLLSSEYDGLRASPKRPVDARTVNASDDWLDTMADAPGEYLKSRLAAEMERRQTSGEAAPEEETQW